MILTIFILVEIYFKVILSFSNGFAQNLQNKILAYASHWISVNTLKRRTFNRKFGFDCDYILEID